MGRSMLDAAGLHDPILNADVWAGYLRSPHSSGGGWPLDYWTRVKPHAMYLLPIYVVGPPYHAGEIVDSIATQMHALGAPLGVAVAIDVEHYDAQSAHAAGIWPQLQAGLNRVGFIPVIYCSKSDGPLFPGRQWLGDWTRHNHQAPGATITQWAASPGWGAPAGYDQSTVHDEGLALWPVRPAPPPVPPAPIPPTVSLPIEDGMTQTDLSMRLDDHGNGYTDLPGVVAKDVRSLTVIGTPDPAAAHAYSPIPRCALTIASDSHVARVIVEGGVPHGPASVRVIHA